MFLVLLTQCTKKSSLQKKTKRTTNWLSWMSKSQKIQIGLKQQYFKKIPIQVSTQDGTAYVPNRYKQNLVQTVLHRGYSICNSLQLRKKVFPKILNLLEKNGFPLNYINRQIQYFLAEKQSKKSKTDEKYDTKRIFIKLPYIKEMNGHIPKKIKSFLKKLDFRVTLILINETFNLKRHFTFKERQNKLHCSSLVYRVTCSCKSTYINQTSRNLITRLKNHDPNFSK